METRILDKLKEIEELYKVNILFACESGSRGWQIPSPDSDYDVRFIYTRHYTSYLSIDLQKDHLNFPVTEELDIYGWDLRKVLRLVRSSNTTPFEWLQSPVVYRQEEAFAKALWVRCQPYFNRRANIYHYLGIAKTALKEMGEDGCMKIKGLFYVLRPLLAACWCLERNTIAPMTMGELMELLPDSLRTKVEELITVKATAREADLVYVEPDLRQYIDDTWLYCNNALAGMPASEYDASALNLFFKEVIIG